VADHTRRIWLVPWQAITCFFDHEGFVFASHIALSVLLAIFPFLIGLATLAGFLGTGDLAGTTTSLIFEIWPQQVAEPLSREITKVLTGTRGGLLTIASLAALYFASNAIEALRAALDRAYDCDDRRPWWRTRAQSIGFALLGAASALLLAFLIVLGPLLFKLLAQSAPAIAELRPALTVLRYGVVIAMQAVTLIVIHLWLPAGRRRLREVLPGIVFTILASLIAGAAFGEYLARAAQTYISTYAGLASPIIALVYLNYTAIIFILGGELNAALLKAGLVARAPPSDRD